MPRVNEGRLLNLLVRLDSRGFTGILPRSVRGVFLTLVIWTRLRVSDFI